MNEEPVKNVYCIDSDDMVIPYKCTNCNKCWLFVRGNKTGSCPWGGPFKGYYTDKEEDML